MLLVKVIRLIAHLLNDQALSTVSTLTRLQFRFFFWVGLRALNLRSSRTQPTPDDRCCLCVPMELLLIKLVSIDAQIAFWILESFRIKYECCSVMHRVHAYLFQIAICMHILLDIKDSDALLDSLIEILNTSPAHRRLIHALRLRR